MGLLLKKIFVLFKKPVFLCLFLTTFLYGCGSSDENKVNFAITEAEIYLNTSDCAGALNALNEIGNQKDNARYLMTLASAYGCKAGYTSTGIFPTFTNFASDVSADNFFGPLTEASTASTMTTGDDIDFLNLQNAIDTLLYAGGLSTSNNPSTSSRATLFSSDDAFDINVLIFYMIFDQLGRYAYYYGCYDGDPDGTGMKGTPREDPLCTNGTNECFASYDSDATLDIGGGSQTITQVLSSNGFRSCTAPNLGHTDLDATEGAYNTSQVSALCRGVVLMNNLREVLKGISEGFQEVDSLKDAFKEITDAFAIVESMGNSSGISNVMSTLSQSKCEADFGADAAGKTKLSIYFVIFFEKMFG
tara:strand:- start:3553 stop:4635 length:1083 start_codon:yes stop_codon:yes gene_type:complete